MESSLSKIPYVNLKKQWLEERDELLPIIDKVFESTQFVGGEELDKFEENIAKFCEVKYAVALNSGTDALIFALHLSGIGRGDDQDFRSWKDSRCVLHPDCANHAECGGNLEKP